MRLRLSSGTPEAQGSGLKAQQLFVGSLVAGIALATPAAQAAPPSAKLSPDLVSAMHSINTGSAKSVRSSFMVRGSRLSSTGEAVVAADPTRVRVLVRSRGAVTSALRHQVGRQVDVMGRTFPRMGVMVIEATPAQLAALAKNPNVISLSPDRPVRTSAALDVNPRSVGADLGGQSSHIDSRLDGRGSNIAVLDSGVAPVDDIAPKLVDFVDFVGGATTPYDDYGHGTHVAGIIAGNGFASNQAGATKTYKGIAPGAGIVGVKVLDANGNGNVSDVIAAIDWCIAHKDSDNIKVINLSLNTGVHESYTTDPLCQAAERAVAAGIVVVAAAGNWGGAYGMIGAPANDPAVIAVGASNNRGTVGRADDVITTYSSRGPTRFDFGIKPDIIAPGNRVVSLRSPGSTIDTAHPGAIVPTSAYTTDTDATSAYTTLSGTSMAAPSVAAAAAIALQANRNLTPGGVKAALMYSAQLLTGYDPVKGTTGIYDPLTQGAGELNVPGVAEVANAMRPSGLRWNLSLANTIGGQSFTWSGGTLASTLVRPNGDWSNSLLTTTTAWTGTALWGNDAWNDGLVWAGNLVWGGTTGPVDPEAAPVEIAFDNTNVWGGANSGVTSTNLVWGGTTGPVDPDLGGDPTLASATNLVWGGTTGPVDPDFSGDSPITPFTK